MQYEHEQINILDELEEESSGATYDPVAELRKATENAIKAIMLEKRVYIDRLNEIDKEIAETDDTAKIEALSKKRDAVLRQYQTWKHENIKEDY